MPRRRAAFTKCELSRIVSVARAAGNNRVEIEPGKVLIVFGEATPQPEEITALDSWRATRGPR